MDGSTLLDRTVPRPVHSATPATAIVTSMDHQAPDEAASTNILLDRGQVALNGALLRRLRQGRLLSQQALAEDCWKRNIRVSLATIKRAESGSAVRFRIAHELARCFGVPVIQIVRAEPYPTPERERPIPVAIRRNRIELVPV